MVKYFDFLSKNYPAFFNLTLILLMLILIGLIGIVINTKPLIILALVIAVWLFYGINSIYEYVRLQRTIRESETD